MGDRKNKVIRSEIVCISLATKVFLFCDGDELSHHPVRDVILVETESSRATACRRYVMLFYYCVPTGAGGTTIFSTNI